MNKNVVFIVNIKDQHIITRSTPYQFSIDSWKIWCDTNNCELFVLEDRIYPKEVMNANWHKLFVFDLLEANDIKYNQILIVDADTIPHPDSPNIFDYTNNKYGVVRNYGSMDWVCRSYENYKKLLFPNVTYSPTDYFNSGVIVLNKQHRDFYKKTQTLYLEQYEFIKTIQQNYGVGTDQPVLNFMSRQENVDIEYLPYEWNMQDIGRFEILNNDLPFINCGWIFHYCAIPGGDDATYYWMEKTFNKLYK